MKPIFHQVEVLHIFHTACAFQTSTRRLYVHRPISSNNVLDTNTYALKSFHSFLNEVSINAHQSVNGLHLLDMQEVLAH